MLLILAKYLYLEIRHIFLNICFTCVDLNIINKLLIFYFLTGLYCPGCGAGRASYSLLHGQILDAFSYNPLMTILLPFIGLYVVVRGMDWVISGENHVDGRISVRLLVAVLILIFVYGVLRNIPTFPFELLAPGGMEKYLVAVSSFSAVRH